MNKEEQIIDFVLVGLGLLRLFLLDIPILAIFIKQLLDIKKLHK